MSDLSPRVIAGTVPLLLPDAASTAALALAEAMEYCARKMRLAGPEAAVEAVKQRDRFACGYCHYSLAGRVAASLGALDDRVKAVYLFEYDEGDEDEPGYRPAGLLSLHLIAQVEQKTDSLRSLADGLDRALVQALVVMMGINAAATVLDVHLVDGGDVERRLGYGALLSAVHNRPILIWER